MNSPYSGYSRNPHRPYSDYKTSGVGYLGDIPKHWKVRRLKYTATIIAGQSPPSENVFEYSGHSPFLQGNAEFGNIYPSPRLACKVPAKIAQAGDVLLSVRAPVGAINVAEQAYGIGRGLCAIRPSTNLAREFAYYALRVGRAGLDMVSTGSTYEAVSVGDVGGLPFPLPPLSEQTAIARYLDHADSRIQHYISAKEWLIELLTEQKQAVINHAVTRGLDPNVPLKPSGVDWLGDMPAHWKRCRLRNVVSAVTTGSRGWSSYASDTGPLFIRIANLERGSFQLRFNDVVRLNLPKTSEAVRTRIRAGDLLVSVTAYIGSVGIASTELGEAYVSQHVARCQPRRGISSEWLGYVLLSEVGQTHGQINLYGGTKDGLSLDDVKNYPILLPPLGEQTAIVEYLDKATADIEVAISRTRRQIDLMQEYRTRLITDVVTGKLDVREKAVALERGTDVVTAGSQQLELDVG